MAPQLWPVEALNGLPLATTDAALVAAAQQAGVGLVLAG